MAKSLLQKIFSLRNHRTDILPPPKRLEKKQPTPRKGKIIIKRKITHKPCNTSPKAKPIDN